jgi:hypothetical protein
MKRTILILLALTLLFAAGCAAKQTPDAPEAQAITAPGQKDVTVTLPLGVRDGMTEELKAYTAGFSAADGAPLTFTVGSEDVSVAEGVLNEDGTLYVIARGPGKAKLTVTAENEKGEIASSTVSVTVRDARRTVAMILIGVIAVALLILFGKPVKKKEEPAVEAEQPTERSQS